MLTYLRRGGLKRETITKGKVKPLQQLCEYENQQTDVCLGELKQISHQIIIIIKSH